jgi:hypothetical protein
MDETTLSTEINVMEAIQDTDDYIEQNKVVVTITAEQNEEKVEEVEGEDEITNNNIEEHNQKSHTKWQCCNRRSDSNSRAEKENGGRGGGRG